MSISVGTIRVVIRQALAYAEKDISQQLRFKVGFLLGIFVPALVNLALFTTIFSGFFKSGAPNTSELNGTTFIGFTLLGTLASTLFTQGASGIQGRFMSEKYWQTALAILASPLSSWALLLGVAVAESVKFLTVAIVFLSATFILVPVSPVVVLATLAMLLVLYAMVSGFSLIRGALFLANENYEAYLGYFIVGTAYVSCFYYPAGFLPSFLQPLAMVNPIYFIVYTMRALWLGLTVEPAYLVVTVVAAVLSPLVGTYIFRKVWRNLDLTGY